MKIETGYVYHVKEEYFKYVNDSKLMKNHEENDTRPNYYCVKSSINSKILWFIPISSKVEKYEKILESKLAKYGKCDTIVIGKYRNRKQAFLIQNMFPITSKYIDHIDTVNDRISKVEKITKNKIEKKVKKIFNLKSKGINLIFPNVDKILSMLINE